MIPTRVSKGDKWLVGKGNLFYTTTDNLVVSTCDIKGQGYIIELLKDNKSTLNLADYILSCMEYIVGVKARKV